MGYIMDLREQVGSRPLIMPGSCVLVFNKEGQLLLQKRTDSLDWGTIGGSMEPGESFEDTARRELFEEAGLTVNAVTFISIFSGQDMYYKYPNGDEVYNVIAMFEVRDVEDEPRINDHESLELGYFSLDEPIPDLNPFSELYLRKAGYIKLW
ncbi:NUDIX hydrolase [Paenibacillus sp. J22TS3]|uniref:NUDIX hydrolase n=1 Tax=Paenibacillus sp. J22TS3 TaxID=2807192 RepID=UPI001B07F095|nr:NUDIX hydrolase [Paenibacillus sp. J22TS3]GIP24659.1 DNA mismatch repair protein MutT [Paenibacillus sp. J22TS3]